MKSEINETTHPDTLSFPCAMKSNTDGTVVMFESVKTGTVIHSRNSYLGHISDDWIRADDASHWTPFKGTITITC